MAVAGQVVGGVCGGAGALAQHVKAVAQAGAVAARGAGHLQRVGHGLAQHELAPQKLHRAQGGGHHGACAQARQQAGRGFALGQKVLAQGNGAAGQAGQGGVASVAEVGPAELVGGERDGGFGVGHAQQRLGQAHQGQAFAAGNRVLLEQALHGPERWRVLPHRLHPGGGHLGRRRPVQRRAERGQAVRHLERFGQIGVRQVLLGQHGNLQNSGIAV